MVEYVPKLSAQVSVSEIVTPGCVVGSTIGKHIKDKGREVRGGGFLEINCIKVSPNCTVILLDTTMDIHASEV